jgi:nucleoside 2-deoxyribosyltransferase
MLTTAPKYFCFVLMPFSVEFDDIYQYGIKESCKEAGAYCERVDEQVFQETILDRIYNQISKSDLVIADMTRRNPNVFYEVGYAHALNKPTILLTQNSDDIPFDLKHYPHIIYEGKISIIREELTKRIMWFQENAQQNIVNYKFELDIYVDDKNLAMGNIIHEYGFNGDPSFNFTIYNNSQKTFKRGDFRIAIISNYHDGLFSEEIKTTRLPDKRYLHMLPSFDELFPGAYASSDVLFGSLFSRYNGPDDFEITIRIFTSFGNRDFELFLKKAKHI